MDKIVASNPQLWMEDPIVEHLKAFELQKNKEVRLNR